MRLYGIKTCDTCRKALKALQAVGHPVEFVDVRADGIPEDRIGLWLDQFGDALVNRSSTTWRGLTEAERSRDPSGLLSAHPTLMKRPVIEDGGKAWLGWSPAVRTELLG